MTTLYRKEGRKYIPCSAYDNEVCNSFKQGSHLVVVQKSLTMYKHDINPEYAPMIAAGLYAKDAMMEALHQASIKKPTQPLITLEELAAWNAMKKAIGDDIFSVSTPSAHDITDAGIAAMQEEAAKLLTNPTVKKAYDNFMLVAKLSYVPSN